MPYSARPRSGTTTATFVAALLLAVLAISLVRPAPARAATGSIDRRCATVAAVQRATCGWLARTAAQRCTTGSTVARKRCFTRRGYARYHLAKLLRQASRSRAGQAVQTAPVAPTPAPAPSPAPVAPVVPVPAHGRSAGEVAADVALSLRGTPYVWGGAAPGGFDCSGLVQYAFARAGRQLPRTTFTQFATGTRVTVARRGDLVFSNGVGHVGIALGDGTYVHAPHTGTVVSVAPMPTKVDGIVRIG